MTNIWTNFPIQHPTFMSVVDLPVEQYHIGIISKISKLFSSNITIICDEKSPFRSLVNQLEFPFTNITISNSIPKIKDDYKFDEALIFFGCPPEESITQIIKNNKYYHVFIVGENIPSSIKTAADQYFSSNKKEIIDYTASRGIMISESSILDVGNKNEDGSVKYVLVDKQMKDVRFLNVCM